MFESEAKSYCIVVRGHRVNQLKYDEIQNNYTKQLMRHITDLVTTTKSDPTKLTTQQLKDKFEQKWIEWTAEFSDDDRKLATEEDIENNMCNILGKVVERHNGCVVSKLKNKNLLQANLDHRNLSIDSKHYRALEDNSDNEVCDDEENNSWIFYWLSKPFKAYKRFKKNNQDNEELRKNEKTARSKNDELWHDVNKSLRELQSTEFVDFDSTFSSNLLEKAMKKVNEFNKEEDRIFFTIEYKVDVAILIAERLADIFNKKIKEKQKNNLALTFREQKNTFFMTFEMLYEEKRGEIIAAKNLCRLLAISIKAMLKQKLPGVIAESMRNSDVCFNYKTTFRGKILQDLAKHNMFELYKQYFTDIESSFEYWIKYYIKKHCKQIEKGSGNYKLTELAKPLITNTVSSIVDTVNTVKRSANIQEWLHEFHKSVSHLIILQADQAQQMIRAHISTSSDMFIDSLIKGLLNEQKKLIDEIDKQDEEFNDITSWDDSPHKILYKHLIGCHEQCPFCGEQCDYTNSDHEKEHFTKIHRPECLHGYVSAWTKKLVIRTCSVSVETDIQFQNKDTKDQVVYYKDYKTIYPNWYISNEKDSQITPKYWQWFVAAHMKDLIQWVGASEESEIDPSFEWHHVTKDDAIKSVSKLHNLP